MTYKEFKDWCFEHDYECVDDGDQLLIKDGIFDYARVNKTRSFFLTIFWDAPKGKDFFDKVVELAGTPIEDREEPKKYYVKIVDREDGYINKTWIGELLLLNKLNGSGYQTQFTEEEIRAIDERYMAFAEEVEQ